MKLEGGCYCGKVRYLAEGEPTLKAQCHCRECQYISGGAPNMFLLMPAHGFKYTKGAPKAFTRSDLEKPVTREFCADCGTHLVTRRPGVPPVIVKVGGQAAVPPDPRRPASVRAVAETIRDRPGSEPVRQLARR